MENPPCLVGVSGLESVGYSQWAGGEVRWASCRVQG